MAETDDKEGGSAHSYAAPYGGEDHPPREEHSRHDWHCEEVVCECPEEIDTHEEVAATEEADQCHDLVQVLGEEHNVCSVDVELRFSVDTDPNPRLLKTRDIVEPVPHHENRLLVRLVVPHPFLLLFGSALRHEAVLWK